MRLRALQASHTPITLEEILKDNDLQLFDRHNDPHEVRNLALGPEKNRETILRMNRRLNDLIAEEVGVNGGAFLKPLLAGGSLAPG